MLVRIGNLAINADHIVQIETTDHGTIYITTTSRGDGDHGMAPIPLTGRDADAFRHWQREHEYDALAALETHEREDARRGLDAADRAAELAAMEAACARGEHLWSRYGPCARCLIEPDDARALERAQTALRTAALVAAVPAAGRVD